MNTPSRLITGSIMFFGGMGLMGLPFAVEIPMFISWIYGLPIFIIGLFILFNRNEDKIESIKSNGGKK